MSRATAERAFLSADGCRALFQEIVGMTVGGGQTRVALVNRWTGTTRWLRNQVALASDLQTLRLNVDRTIREASGGATTTRLDEAGLREVVQAAERTRAFRLEAPREVAEPFVNEPILRPAIWSAPTFALTAEARTELTRPLAAGAESAGLFASGTFAVAGQGHATIETNGMFRYYPVTAVECAVTVRDAAGTASGWAGVTHHDLARVDLAALGARALDKCRRAARPKAVEPGRYTVILEPQAVHDLVAPLVENAMERGAAEAGLTPFSGGSAESLSKIGSQVIDRRLTLGADPMDPDAAFLPFDDRDGTPYRAVTWIEDGVLRELAYDGWYSARTLGEETSLLNSESFRLQAAPGVTESSVEEMIASTKRGLLVTRFSDVRVVSRRNMLCTGYTRDGLWLIENGKIAMPVKNFQFADSPMFALNSVEAIGAAVRVFSPGRARIAPALKVRDFNFIALADAV